MRYTIIIYLLVGLLTGCASDKPKKAAECVGEFRPVNGFTTADITPGNVKC